MIEGRVKKIEAGLGFYMALTTTGDLYAWGNCEYFGREHLTHKEEKIFDIVQPILVMKGIEDVSCGRSHLVCQTKDNKFIGWGNKRGFKNV